MNKLNILVFPCGSEVGLEIYRSMKYSRHVKLFGASSVDDHGKFVYENYFGGLPMLNESNFLTELKKVLKDNDIAAIYPAMDIVIAYLKPLEEELNCKIISSPPKTIEICSSKKETYANLNNIVNIPKIYNSINDVDRFPVFVKPNIGYGSRGARIIHSIEEGDVHIREWGDCIISEYLPGEEYTVDCFTNQKGKLMFVGPRPRRRTRNGISVNTISIEKGLRADFENMAGKINRKLKFQGAWFFQVKKDRNNNLSLLEVASRMGGSSLLYRYKGINFALLSIFDAFGYDVSILENNVNIEIDRALDVEVKMDFEFDYVYMDFDDCLIIDNKVNVMLVSSIYRWINQNKKIILITKHEPDIYESLKKYRLIALFDEIIHINKEEKKSKYINKTRAIFVDDSFEERKDVFNVHKIPVFSPDATP